MPESISAGFFIVFAAAKVGHPEPELKMLVARGINFDSNYPS